MKRTKLSLKAVSISSFTTSSISVKDKTRFFMGGESTDERLCTANCPTDPYCTYGECFTQGSPYGDCSAVWYC